MGDAPTVVATRIEGTRVRLRKARDNDGVGLIETQTDERVRRYLGGPRSERDVRAMVESVGAASLLAPAGCFVVASTETDEMLGTMELSRRSPELPGHVQEGGNELELTYVFLPHTWGYGYAAEAARRCCSARLSSFLTNRSSSSPRPPIVRLCAWPSDSDSGRWAPSSNTMQRRRWRPLNYVLSCTLQYDNSPRTSVVQCIALHNTLPA